MSSQWKPRLSDTHLDWDDDYDDDDEPPPRGRCRTCRICCICLFVGVMGVVAAVAILELQFEAEERALASQSLSQLAIAALPRDPNEEPAQQEPVMFIFHIDPMKRCKHVNFIERSHIMYPASDPRAGQPREDEYLFTAYSVFTVRECEWRAGNIAEPHIIDIEAANDNAQEGTEDLKLAPWS